MTTTPQKGWAKLPRRLILETWYRDTYTVRIYTHLLLSSSISDDKFITSIAQLAKEMRLTTKQVRRALFLLTTGDYISTQTCAQGTTITLIVQTKGQTETPINTATQPNEGQTTPQIGQTEGQTKGQTETPINTATQPNEGQTEGQTKGQLLNNIIDNRDKYKVYNITDANIIKHTIDFFKYKQYEKPIDEARQFTQYNIKRNNLQLNINQLDNLLDRWHQRNTTSQVTNAPKFTYNDYVKMFGTTVGACWVDAIGAKNGGRLMRLCDAQANNIPILKICGE